MTRLIAGRAGGRRIAAPGGADTRPTTDRVREAVFSALAAWAGTAGEAPDAALAGLGFCDLYAGSGAMALEAASRGAAPVLAIEAARPAAEIIRRNAREVGLAVTVSAQRAETALQRPAGCGYDIVWADPPYALDSADLDRVIGAAVANGWLVPDGLLAIERSSRTPAPRWPPGFEHWSRRYGETTIHYAQRGPDPAPAERDA
ncbi:16S rRNA (guanine966-N2)-methyltransferase [Naumannella cuiyingiana]|uniref:16S rRNA (Guanine966-N2)-methyltransferase n=1 Tax=Naumannella cuiyingiana TaxID=1347891 RepID=A0A7Z0IM55_9ACTN|nr:16S rRNA (guanine(966)-N(2))-methyltransferase RsmD [Naumannella cuiyingiana]NYI72261.1 16S rRNA (guanine966-N2)-methyltransferase [Naumannella cuiyingiana]